MADRNWQFIAAAYIVTWVVILGYTSRVQRALRRARAARDRAITQARASGT